MLYSILVAIDVLIAIALIALILIQHGKGANVGAAFGSGASGTIFGARGSSSFLSRLTAILAALFFINSIGLTYLVSHRPQQKSVVETELEKAQEQASKTPSSTSTDIPHDVTKDTPATQTTATPNADYRTSSQPQDQASDVKKQDTKPTADEPPSTPLATDIASDLPDQ